MSERKVYNKLVRDKIPEIIAAKGGVATTKTLLDDEYVASLRQKLQEEVDEFLADSTIEELADILEVVHALGRTLAVEPEEIEQVRQRKSVERGGFADRIYLVETTQ